MLLMRANILILLVAMSSSYDFANLKNNWKCKDKEAKGTILGNFPKLASFVGSRGAGYVGRDIGADLWTTFPVEKSRYSVDDYKNQISRPWQVPADPISFYVKPKRYGERNRIIFQIALDDKKPTTPPYPDATKTRLLKHMDWKLAPIVQLAAQYNEKYGAMKKLMEEGLFNCHINRYQSYMLDTFENIGINVSLSEQIKQRDATWKILNERDRECRGGMSSQCRMAAWEIENQKLAADLLVPFNSTQDEIGCNVGIRHPFCCYAQYNASERRNIQKYMSKDDYPMNQGDTCQMYGAYNANVSCSRKPNPKVGEEFIFGNANSPYSTDDIRKEIDVLVYQATTTKEPECNINTKNTSLSCLFSQNKKYPCFASCYRSIVLQVELTAVKSAPSKISVSVVAQRYTLKQPSIGAPEEKLTIPNPEDQSKSPLYSPYFGYEEDEHVLQETKDVYLGLEFEQITNQKIKLSTEEFTGIWLNWTDRIAEQGKVEQGKGPILKVGVQGSEQAVIDIDLSKTVFKTAGYDDPYGFRFGWRGVEMQRPFINYTFRPQYITINSVRDGAGFERITELPCEAPTEEQPQCTDANCGTYPSSKIIIAAAVLLGLAVVIAAAICCIGMFRKKKAKGKK